MKNLTVLALFVASISFGQVKTSVQDGNFYAFATWDCFCLPAIGDTLIINHAVVLNADLYYDAGHIEINGSLLDDGSNRDVWINGGSMENNGNFDAYRLYISAGSLENNGNIVYLDSLWNKGAIDNSGNINVYDVLTDQPGTVNNTGVLNVDNNFNNQGIFNNIGVIDVRIDFSNCNIQSMDAIFTNDGTFCIGNDFSNCGNDTLTGSGVLFIANQSTNLGAVEGNGVINTPSGSFNFNSGTVASSVTFGTDPCNLSADELQQEAFSIFPNPATSIIETTYQNFEYAIYDYAGRMVDYGSSEDFLIYVDHLEKGVYWLRVHSAEGELQAVKFIKE